MCRRLPAAGAVVIAVALVGTTPRIAMPFAFAGRIGTRDGGEPSNAVENAAQTRREWRRLEELLQLEADLQRLDNLLLATPRQAGVAKHIDELNRQAVVLRARRTHLASLFEKDSQR